jgi:hypothetical protein
LVKTFTFFLVAALLPIAASGEIIHVPDEMSDVAEALLAASAFDTVLVAPGTYPVNTQWPDKQGIKLLSEAGPEVTFLDGRGKDNVIWLNADVDTTTVIAGFTIMNGQAEGI